MRRCRLWVAAALLLLPTFLPHVAFAGSTPGERLAEIRKELERLRSALQENEAARRGVVQEIARLDAEELRVLRERQRVAEALAAAEAELARAEEELGRAEAEAGRREDEAAAARARLGEAEEQLARRVRLSYLSSPAGLLSALISGSDLASLGGRWVFVRAVLEGDSRSLDEARRAKEEADRALALALQAREVASSLRARVAARRDQVADLLRRLDRQAGLLERLKAERGSLLRTLEQQKEEYLQAMAALEAESRRISALLRGRRGSGSAGKLVWPTQGEVTSGYGWRTHPVFGDRRFHAGIDIGAPMGQSVVAAAAGEVVLAGVISGYGLTVVVQHAGSLATLYAHLSEVKVGEGERVSAGQVIAAVGCSGYCTGPHLHFEVRVDGEPQDPMGYF